MIKALACEDCGAVYVAVLSDGICRGCSGKVVQIPAIRPDPIPSDPPPKPWWQRLLS